MNVILFLLICWELWGNFKLNLIKNISNSIAANSRPLRQISVPYFPKVCFRLFFHLPQISERTIPIANKTTNQTNIGAIWYRINLKYKLFWFGDCFKGFPLFGMHNRPDRSLVHLTDANVKKLVFVPQLKRRFPIGHFVF